MTLHRLCTRLQRLEQHAQAQEAGLLHIWRLPEESVEEAFDRCAVDPADVPHVRVHVWPGARVSSRLLTAPAPLWVSRDLPAIADLEARLHQGLQERRGPR